MTTDSAAAGRDRRLPHLEGAMTTEGRATYHVEDGMLPCWCALDRDHTRTEFFEYLDRTEGGTPQ